MRTILFLLIAGIPALLRGETDLSSKIVHLFLNQNEPSVIRVGVQGITTLEFPTKIEALEGYGFSLNPAPDGADQFQISFNKGTNFISVKALRPGAEGNLTVVLDSKVYALYCKEASDSSFVVIFEDSPNRHSARPTEGLAKTRSASPARVMGFLDKVKGFPALKNSAPEMFSNLDVAEPGSRSAIGGVDLVLKRVVRDDGLDSVGFEVELINKTDRDFLYDPESFGTRVGDQVFAQSVSDAGGLLPAGKSQTAYFVVTGTANGARNDLAVTNQFDVLLHQVTGEMDPHRKVSAEWQEPPDSMAQASPMPEPSPNSSSNGQAATAVVPDKSNSAPGHKHKESRRSSGSSKEQKVAQHGP
jgi:hypothetical protein